MTHRDLPRRYSIKSLLGAGGSSRVYQVRDSLRDRDLALKLVTCDESAFLRREFDALRQIRHENLIQVFDWGAIPLGGAYYTMELIEGEDWHRQLGQPQADADVRRILTGLLRGLSHLHCHGAIHGDLKPGNVLLGRAGAVKVADVGMGDSGGASAGASGTPGYAAPEVWQGQSANERSDIYSVGVMVYEALTGRHPFGAKTIREVVAGQIEGWVPSPGAFGIRVAADLERSVMRALERDPALRQGSADEWMESVGVENRVGRILQGRFVEREECLSLGSAGDDAGGPAITLVGFYGEDGIGRTRVLEEISQSVLSGRGTVVRAPISSFCTVGMLANEVATQADGPLDRAVLTGRSTSSWTELARCFVRGARTSPLALVVDGRFCFDLTLLRNLRHFALALRDCLGESRELGSAYVRVFASFGFEPDSPEPHERFVFLKTFDPAGVSAQIRGLLGKAEIPSAVSERLCELTRGVPGLVSAATFELIDTSVLQRRAGRWYFDEAHPVETLQLVSVTDPMGQLWRRTPEGMRKALAYIALLRSGAPTEVLHSAGQPDAEAILDQLNQLGWLRRTRSGWAVASPPLRSFVLSAADAGVTREGASALLSLKGEGIAREDYGDLVLMAGNGLAVWEGGLISARLAADRGEHQLTLERLQALLDRRDLTLPVGVRCEVALLRAEAMHHLGMDRVAVGLLLDHGLWEDAPCTDQAKLRRARLLGVLYGTIGEVGEAKEWLHTAVQLARAAGSQSEYLQAIADLTQIEWEHGTRSEREQAIATIRETLGGSANEMGLEDERTALSYGLGAALIWNGDRASAKVALLEGLRTTSSEYWKMRIANALSSASMYLGDYEESLRWSHEAWMHAERSGTDGFRARILSNRGATLHALGRLRESAEADIAAAEWGRRTGNPYEYEAGIAGAAINLLLLARYEDALKRAVEVHLAAEHARNERHVAKGLELRALGHYFLGELEEAQRLVVLGQSVLAMHEYLDTKPRLDWLDARISMEKGDLRAGLAKLKNVEAGLLEIRDLEDLWGVQIELYLARARIEGDPSVVELLARVIEDARSAGIRVAWIGGALAIGEVVTDLELDDREYRTVVRDGLAMAEECGMLELSWQLAYRIGLMALREGDLRESQARFTHATRIVKEIASHLAPPHQVSYMNCRRVRLAVETMARSL